MTFVNTIHGPIKVANCYLIKRRELLVGQHSLIIAHGPIKVVKGLKASLFRLKKSVLPTSRTDTRASTYKIDI
jgi:hypothetical protein